MAIPLLVETLWAERLISVTFPQVGTCVNASYVHAFAQGYPQALWITLWKTCA